MAERWVVKSTLTGQERRFAVNGGKVTSADRELASLVGQKWPESMRGLMEQFNFAVSIDKEG